MDFNNIIVSDTGWKDSPRCRPNIGYHDYIRTIQFSPKLSETAIKMACEVIKQGDGNFHMWYYYKPDPVDPYKVEFNKGYDSGD